MPDVAYFDHLFSVSVDLLGISCCRMKLFTGQICNYQLLIY